MHKELEPDSCTQVNGPLESNPSEVVPEAEKTQCAERSRPASKALLRHVSYLFSDSKRRHLRHQANWKQLGQSKKGISGELTGDIVNLLGLFDLKKII